MVYVLDAVMHCSTIKTIIKSLVIGTTIVLLCYAVVDIFPGIVFCPCKVTKLV